MKKSPTHKRKKETIVVETYNIKVGARYYSFDYKVWRNGKLIEETNYNSSHTRSPQTMRKYLNNGYATDIALENL